VAIPTGAGSEVPRAASTVAAVGQVAAAVVVVGVKMGAALAAGAVVTLAAVLAAGDALLELPQAARATLRTRAASASERKVLKDTAEASIRAGRPPDPPKRR